MNDGFFMRVTSILSATASKEAAPLWTFNQNSPLASQFIGQHCISYSPSIIFHNAKLYHFSWQNTTCSAFWRDFIRRFGAISFGVLAQYHSAFWRISQSIIHSQTIPAQETDKRCAAKQFPLHTFLYNALWRRSSEQNRIISRITQ